MPTILYVLLRWRKTTTEFTFIEILCIYGYSLFIYIPIALLWMINISILQWILVLLAIVLSGSVLAFTFWPVFSADSKGLAIFVTCMILVFHAALGLSFMLYFFHYPNPNSFIPVANLNISNTTSHQPFTNSTYSTITLESLNETNHSSTTTISTSIAAVTKSFVNYTFNSTASLNYSFLSTNDTSFIYRPTNLINYTNSSIRNE